MVCRMHYGLSLIGWGLLYVHRNRRLIRDGSPRRPPRLSHSSWALLSLSQFSCLYSGMHSDLSLSQTSSCLAECTMISVWVSSLSSRMHTDLSLSQTFQLSRECTIIWVRVGSAVYIAECTMIWVWVRQFISGMHNGLSLNQTVH